MTTPPMGQGGKRKRPLSQRELAIRIDQAKNDTIRAMGELPHIDGVAYFKQRIKVIFDAE